MKHTEIIEFRYPEFEHDKGHYDLFGTLVRFLPLFKIDEKKPKWADTIKEEGCVFITDADYSDFFIERIGIKLIKWYSKKLDNKKFTPDIVALSYPSSTAIRHKPSLKMPPIIANFIATKKRIPYYIFENFLEQGKNRNGLPLRYYNLLNKTENINYAYKKRNINKQKSMFPFGIDEYFLTNVLKSYNIIQNNYKKWLFLVYPNIDRVITRCNNEIKKSEILELKEPLIKAFKYLFKILGNNVKLNKKKEIIKEIEKIPNKVVDILKLYSSKENPQSSTIKTLNLVKLFLIYFLKSILMGNVNTSFELQKYIVENLEYFTRRKEDSLFSIYTFTIGYGKVNECFNKKNNEQWKENLYSYLKN